MRNTAFFALVIVTGVGLFLYFNAKQPQMVLNIDNRETKQSANKVFMDVTVSSQNNYSSAEQKSISSATASEPTFNELVRPEEAAIWNEWCEDRGYDVDGSLTRSYDALSDEVLLTLANQHDPKAHLVLANRIIAAQSGLNVSHEALTKAEGHLYAASVLGYTSTLATLSELRLRVAFKNPKQKNVILADAYKFLYVGVKRGDPNSITSLEVLNKTNPISDQEATMIMANADVVYDELSEQRKLLGLPSFDNSVPIEVQAIVKRVQQMSFNNELMK
ncbi:MAG: hypothetical protein B0W54_01335 [Cellvibrio sp. 79]|nr:MAG: hypothetical protein B0W54_01335 [Cellvibrio sp. 79]